MRPEIGDSTWCSWVDPRLLHRRLGLQVGGIGVGVLLLAHGLVGDQQASSWACSWVEARLAWALW